MPKINVYLPDDLADAVRETGVPVSAICQRALEQAVRRVTAIRAGALSDLDGADLAARLPHATERTRTIVRLAAEQARDTGAPVVSTGHLLAALLAEGENLALRVLTALEVDPAELGRRLAAERDAEPGAGPDGARQLSVPAAGALELAVTEAAGFGHNYLGSEHLLLGLVAEPDGAAGRVLRAAGVELRPARRAVAAALIGFAHLRAKAQPLTDPATLVDAVRREILPLVERVERLEEQVAARG
ncbi:Clp protease N-terminal domain-containing protein [Catellatospora sp. NPDC049609]|uniref:Clp protease N-terminal domain-containing protein n=1 Tax=Catellatospora sp. NPDC049609 TaxID=3155505 RepID=UPI0034296CF3